jgi:cytochrome b561
MECLASSTGWSWFWSLPSLVAHRPPPDTLVPALGAVSKITHLLLYAVLLAIPLLGWANASFRGWVVRLLGALSYPNLTPVGSSLGHAMGDIHNVLAWVLFALIVTHVAAALCHHFIQRDQVLQRVTL